MDPRAQSMLSPMASAGIPLPGRGGFFSSCDPNVHQQVQHSQHRAQSQAQINLLQQQNDLLSQQLAHQVTSQVPSTHQLPTASFQPASSNQSMPPPQPSSNVEPTSTSTPTASTFDSSEMEGRYGLVDKTHPSCVRPGLNTRVQH